MTAMTSADDTPTTTVVRHADRTRALAVLQDGAREGRVSQDTFDRRAGLLMTAERPEEITAQLADLPFRRKRGTVTHAVGRLSAFRRRVRQAWDAERHPALVLPPVGRHPMSVGRSPGSVLRLSDPSVSRFHAQLHATTSGWTLRDIGSANGTWVNGSRVLTTAPVAPGDVVAFGAVTYRLTTS